jgi:hypothetical protein
MSFRDELSPKVAEIERLARFRYDEMLSGNGLGVGQDGAVVDDPEAAGTLPVDLEWEQQQYDAFVSYLDTVKSRFEYYYDLDKMELIDLVAQIGGIEDYPSNGDPYSAFDRIDAQEGRSEWSGRAATTFYEDFLEPFQAAADKQQACTRVLGMVATCVLKGVSNAQDDLLAIADAAIAAFRGEGDSADWGGFLTVASFVSTALGFLSGPLGVGVWAVSLATGVGAYFAAIDDADDQRQVVIEAPNAPIGLESLSDALVAFGDELDRKDQQMSAPLEKDLDDRSAFASPALRLPNLEIDDHGDFGRHLVGTVVDGVPLAQQESVVTVVALHEAGSRNLPSAAYQMETAASHLNDTMPASFRTLFYQTASTFQQCREQVRAAVSAIARDLEDTGPILVDVAKNYEVTDEENAEIQRQIERLLPPVTEPDSRPYR